MHLYVRFERGGRERGREGSALVESHADAPVLVETEEDVAVSAGHEAKEGGRVPLQSERANGLSDLHVHDDDLSRVHDEQVVFVGRGEDDLPAVYLCHTLLPSASQRERTENYTVHFPVFP